MEGELEYSAFEVTSAPECACNEGECSDTRNELSFLPPTCSSSGEERPTTKKFDKNKPNLRRFLKFLEVLLLGFVLLLIIGMFSLASVYYALPSDNSEPGELGRAPTTCAEVEPYSGQICTDMLTSVQTCYSGELFPPPALNIPSAVDQQQGETIVTQILGGLALLNPSPECAEMIGPFLCLHIFGLCDSDSNLRTAQREECLRLRDSVCAQELEIAMSFPIPVCENLPNATDGCTRFSTVNSSAQDSFTVELDSEQPDCPQGLFRNQNGTGVCRPECGQFILMPLVSVIIERSSNCLGLLASVIVFILALTIQRDILLKFPTILLVYLCGTKFIQNTVIIVGYFDNTKLFCGSRDQIFATGPGNETTYCTLSGTVFNYCLQQTFLWALLHAIFLFWGINFPFSYRRLRNSGRMRHAHIISVILALLLPLPGTLVPLKDGFLATLYPTIFCIGRNDDHFFFTLVLPISIILTITSCLLTLTSWTIFKELVIRKLIAGRKVRRVGNAVFKTSAIVLYYIMTGVSFLMGYIYFEATRGRFRELTLCRSLGRQDCDGTAQNTFIVLTVVTTVFQSFISVVVLMFSFSTKDCKKIKAKNCCSS